jgi:hypothetical protein
MRFSSGIFLTVRALASRWASRSMALLVCTLCFLMGLIAAGNRPIVAQQAETEGAPEPLLYKFGKDYISLTHISHVIDEPGFNMPPGSLQILFGGGNQTWLALYDEEADAFRQALAKVSVDMMPKTKVATAKKKSRRAVLAPAAGTVPAAPATPAASAPAPPAQQVMPQNDTP